MKVKQQAPPSARIPLHGDLKANPAVRTFRSATSSRVLKDGSKKSICSILSKGLVISRKDIFGDAPPAVPKEEDVNQMNGDPN